MKQSGRTGKTVRAFCALAALCAAFGLLLVTVLTPARFSGLLLLCAAGVLLLLALLTAQAEKRRWARTLQRLVLLCVLLGLLVFAGLEGWILSETRTDTETETSCVIVLGAGVNGTEPSLALRLRLEAALRYLADKPGLPVIVTGSQGAGEEISEAECMARYLKARGIAADRIHLEEQADDTAENLAYSKAIMEELGLDGTKPAALVTNDFHICRAKLLAERQGLSAVGVGCRFPAPYAALQVNYCVREAFGLARALLLGH